MKKRSLFILIFAVLLLSGCADAVDITTCADDDPYGFFSGLWHGLIFFFSLIGSIFSDGITVYAVNNTGFWYDFGYFIGLGGFTVSTTRRRR